MNAVLSFTFPAGTGFCIATRNENLVSEPLDNSDFLISLTRLLDWIMENNCKSSKSERHKLVTKMLSGINITKNPISRGRDGMEKLDLAGRGRLEKSSKQTEKSKILYKLGRHINNCGGPKSQHNLHIIFKKLKKEYTKEFEKLKKKTYRGI